MNLCEWAVLAVLTDAQPLLRKTYIILQRYLSALRLRQMSPETCLEIVTLHTDQHLNLRGFVDDCLHAEVGAPLHIGAIWMYFWKELGTRDMGTRPDPDVLLQHAFERRRDIHALLDHTLVFQGDRVTLRDDPAVDALVETALQKAHQLLGPFPDPRKRSWNDVQQSLSAKRRSLSPPLSSPLLPVPAE